jgi:hypothetical protein
MLSVGTLTYLDPKLFLLIIFYNGALLFSKVLIILDVDECMYIFFFSGRIVVGGIALIDFLLLS